MLRVPFVSHPAPRVVGLVLNSAGVQIEQQPGQPGQPSQPGPDGANCVRCGSLCPADAELCLRCAAEWADRQTIDPQHLVDDDDRDDVRPCEGCGLLLDARFDRCFNCGRARA